MLLIWTCLVGNLAGGTSEDVTANDGEVREQLAHFGVGEDEGEEGAEMLYGLLAVVLCLLLVDWDDLVRVLLCTADVNIAGVPDEVLEEFIGVLLLDDETRGVDDVTGILDQLLAIVGELPGVDRGVLENVCEGAVDLLVGGHAGLAEGLDDTVKAELAVDIGSLGLLVDGVDDGALGHDQSARHDQTGEM